MRHGETVFNRVYGATRRDPGVADPALTEVGRAQAEAAARRLAGEDVRRLIASPYTRALETAEIVARHLRIPVTVDARVRERAAFACDVGTGRSALASRWSGLALDQLDEVW
jgi:broad specificity phosphatase PhoE